MALAPPTDNKKYHNTKFYFMWMISTQATRTNEPTTSLINGYRRNTENTGKLRHIVARYMNI